MHLCMVSSPADASLGWYEIFGLALSSAALLRGGLWGDFTLSIFPDVSITVVYLNRFGLFIFIRCTSNTLSFRRNLEDSAPFLGVTLPIFDAWFVTEEALKLPETFLSLSISIRVSEVFSSAWSSWRYPLLLEGFRYMPARMASFWRASCHFLWFTSNVFGGGSKVVGELDFFDLRASWPWGSVPNFCLPIPLSPGLPDPSNALSFWWSIGVFLSCFLVSKRLWNSQRECSAFVSDFLWSILPALFFIFLWWRISPQDLFPDILQDLFWGRLSSFDEAERIK